MFLFREEDFQQVRDIRQKSTFRNARDAAYILNTTYHGRGWEMC